MLEKLTVWLLKSKIESDNRLRQRKFLSWERVEKMAVIIEASSALSKNAMDTYLLGLNKYVQVFFIELASKEASYADWECFTKKDKSFMGMPKKGSLTPLKASSFDLVINTCPEDDLFATGILLNINATLKCSMGSRFNESDLIIKKTEGSNLIKYMEDVLHYLKMIKP